MYHGDIKIKQRKKLKKEGIEEKQGNNFFTNAIIRMFFF